MGFEYQDIVIVPVIMGISELLKHVGFNTKFIPIVNMVLGLIAGILYLSPTDIKLGVLQGVIMGLSASGFYSGVKNVKEGITRV